MTETDTSLKRTAYFFTIITGLAVLFFVLKVLQDIFVPLVIAYFLYFIFTPLNNYLLRKKFPQWAVIVLNILIILTAFGGIAYIFIGTFSHFRMQFPEYGDKLSRTVSKTASALGINDPAVKNFQLNDLVKEIDFKDAAGALFASTFSFFGSLLLVIFFYIFVVTGHEIFFHAFRERFTDSVPEESKDNTTEKSSQRPFSKTYQEIVDQVNGYFVTKILTSLGNAIVEGLIIWLWGVEFALLWALIIFLLNFIPNIGSIISLTLPCIVALIQFNSITTVILLGLTLLIIDEILGSIVEPKIFGDSLGINPLVILLSLLIWGYIWGITGALLSVPLTAVFKIIISKSSSPNLVFINELMNDK